MGRRDDILQENHVLQSKPTDVQSDKPKTKTRKPEIQKPDKTINQIRAQRALSATKAQNQEPKEY